MHIIIHNIHIIIHIIICLIVSVQSERKFLVIYNIANPQNSSLRTVKVTSYEVPELKRKSTTMPDYLVTGSSRYAQRH